MWCLCRFNAISLCSWDTKRTKASPLRRPCGDKQSATPPLEIRWLFLYFIFIFRFCRIEVKRVNILSITWLQLKTDYIVFKRNAWDRLCFRNASSHCHPFASACDNRLNEIKRKFSTYLATFNPRKNLAMSWSLLCHGRPRARTMHNPSISSSIELQIHKIRSPGYIQQVLEHSESISNFWLRH